MRRILVFIQALFMICGLARALEFHDIGNYTLQLVNAFRANPVACAEEMGILEETKKAWGGKFSLLEEGLSPLVLDPRLQEAARLKVEDMVQNGYFSVVSPSGVGPDALVAQTGYTPLFSGVAIAYLAFENFVAPQQAVSYILTLLEKRSLLMADKGSTSLLFPPYTRAGFALATVRLTVNSEPMNVYIFCAVFSVDKKDTDSLFIVGWNYPASLVFFNASGERIPPLIFPDGSYYVPLTKGKNFYCVGDCHYIHSFSLVRPLRIDF